MSQVISRYRVVENSVALYINPPSCQHPRAPFVNSENYEPPPPPLYPHSRVLKSHADTSFSTPTSHLQRQLSPKNPYIQLLLLLNQACSHPSKSFIRMLFPHTGHSQLNPSSETPFFCTCETVFCPIFSNLLLP